MLILEVFGVGGAVPPLSAIVKSNKELLVRVC